MEVVLEVVGIVVAVVVIVTGSDGVGGMGDSSIVSRSRDGCTGSSSGSVVAGGGAGDFAVAARVVKVVIVET